MPTQDHPPFLSPTYVPPIYPEKNWNKILIIGEAPGADEERARTPFIGASGTLLNKLLSSASLSREETAITNVLKYRPHNNDFSPLYLTVQEGKKKRKTPHPFLTQSITALHQEIATHKPAIVMPAGNEALQAILDLTGISNRRASCYPPTTSRPYWTIPILHPAAIIRGAQWQECTFTQLAFSRASFLKDFPSYTPRGYSLSTLDSKEGIEFLHNIPDIGYWSLDLEGDPDARSIHCIGIAYQPTGDPITYAACIPYPAEGVYRALQETFNRIGHNLVNQNVSFDLNWLYEDKGITCPTPAMDVMHAFHLLYPELPKRLGTICTWWFGQDIPYYKDERKVVKKKMGHVELERYYTYNQLDAIVALWAAEKAHAALSSSSQLTAYYNHHRPLYNIAQEMTYNGLHIDHQEVTTLRASLTSTLSLADAHIRAAMTTPDNPSPNPTSIPQLRQWLTSQKIKLPTNREGKDTTDEAAITEILLAHPSLTPLHSLLITRKLSKSISNFLVPLNTRSHIKAAWNPDNTETFRFTSSTYLFREGLNLQTIPKELRYLFIPPPDKLFLSADLSQAEARYVAHRSNCSYLLDLFNDPTRNVHMERASDIFFGHIIKKDSPEYVLAKSSLHAGNYRMGPRLFSAQSAIPYSLARTILARANRRTPEIRAWHEAIKTLIKQKGKITNCFNLSRTCYKAIGAYLATGDIPETEWKELIAWEPQSSIPYQINLFLLWLKQQYQDTIQLHHHGHDSFLASISLDFITPANHRALIAKLTTPFPPIANSPYPLTIPSTLEIGLTWGEMVEWHEHDTVNDIVLKWRKKYGHASSTRLNTNHQQIIAALCYVPGLPLYSAHT